MKIVPNETPSGNGTRFNERVPTCRHHRTRLARTIGRDGRSWVLKQCSDCGVNVNGAGVWVSQRDLPCRVEDLPIVRDLRTPETKGQQRLLFPEVSQ